LIQQLSHSYITYYDNISGIPSWISDQLCRAVSGAASSKRQLYTDDDDIIRSYKRIIGINGINLAATKPDLLDRSIITKLERIADGDQRTPEEIWKEFEEIRPQLLGYIFDILVRVLHYEETNPNQRFKLFRMSEFSKYGEIIARCMGYPEDEFINVYERNRRIQTDEIIESSQVASCLMYMMFTKYGETNGDFRPEWEGTSSALLGEFRAIAEADADGLNIDTRDRQWPKNASVLSRRVHELETTLKEAGLEIIFYKSNDRKRTRKIKICKIPSESSVSSADEHSCSTFNENKDANADGNESLFKTSTSISARNCAQDGDCGRADDIGR
jgi:hypothetical protein